jgi:hypothetical protein
MISTTSKNNTMPPRLPASTACIRPAQSTNVLASFLVPFLQTRNASILSSLSDNPGAYSKRIRRGRGPSSGKGKTSGRGHKGQKQHGKVPARFQGGQTPQEIVHGERGFENLYVFPNRAHFKQHPLIALLHFTCQMVLTALKLLGRYVTN